MKAAIDINYFELFMGYALMLIPLLTFWYYKTGLVKDTIIATLRMTIQLLLVGIYLEYIFDLNNFFINLLWVFTMIIISSYTITMRCQLKLKLFFIPVLCSIIISVAITDAYFLGYIIKLDNIFDARYFIPITGMLLGNIIKNIIIAVDSYYEKIHSDQNTYRWYIANGATRDEALLPFMRYALHISFNPMIASTAIMGLISLPGMMTGQILGGSDPSIAIKYQIMLIITIFASAVLSVLLTIRFSNRLAFDKMDNLKTSIFKFSA